MKDPITFEIGGVNYQASHMDAITQFHVARRLAPVLPALKALSGTDGNGGPAWSSLSAISEIVAKMPDEDVNYVLDACLSRVSRRKEGETGWAKLWNSNAKALMFQDLTFPEMLMIAVQVIAGSLGNFMAGLLPSSIDAAAPELASRQ